MTFSTGLKGIADGSGEHEADFDQVEGLILQTLQDLTRQGIDPQTIAAAVNTTEFRLRENNTGSFPRGLLLMLRALNSWSYDGDPLAYKKEMEALFAVTPADVQRVAKKYLTANRVRLDVIPGPLTERAPEAVVDKSQQPPLPELKMPALPGSIVPLPKKAAPATAPTPASEAAPPKQVPVDVS